MRPIGIAISKSVESAGKTAYLLCNRRKVLCLRAIYATKIHSESSGSIPIINSLLEQRLMLARSSHPLLPCLPACLPAFTWSSPALLKFEHTYTIYTCTSDMFVQTLPGSPSNITIRITTPGSPDPTNQIWTIVTDTI
jgi:hypothetical protein